MIKNTFIFIAISLLIISCGKGTISIDENQYEPKIVVDGYLQPGHSVDKIYIWRNFLVNQNLDNFDIVLDDADVWLTDVSDDRPFRLSYYPDSAWFRYTGSDLDIKYGHQYRLDITAVIDGKNLAASSTTTTPNPGFHILNINYDTLNYRQRNESDDILTFNINFERSPGTDFYAAAIIPVHANPDSFIYNNPFNDTTFSTYC